MPRDLYRIAADWISSWFLANRGNQRAEISMGETHFDSTAGEKG